VLKKYLLRSNSPKVSIIKFDEQTESSLKPDSLMLERREGNTSHNFILYTLQCKTIQQPNYKYLLVNKGIKHGYVNLYSLLSFIKIKITEIQDHHAVFPYIPLLTQATDFLPDVLFISHSKRRAFLFPTIINRTASPVLNRKP